jgi:NAD(P)-dependent dehydrogenase (short-subunit alcohol dehydrogenase family)
MGAIAYSASKATVIGLVRAVVAEMACSGVRVNAISPYAILTPLALATFASWFPGRGLSAEEIKPMVEIDMNVMDGTKLEEVDIARAALYLASDDAKYVNGHNLVVDGGCTVSRSAKNTGTGPRSDQRSEWILLYTRIHDGLS